MLTGVFAVKMQFVRPYSPRLMKTFVVWTGVLSILSGAAFQFPQIAAQLMPGVAPGTLLHVFSLMAIFLGVMLVFCARDLAHGGVLVAWEACCASPGVRL